MGIGSSSLRVFSPPPPYCGNSGVVTPATFGARALRQLALSHDPLSPPWSDRRVRIAPGMTNHKFARNGLSSTPTRQDSRPAWHPAPGTGIDFARRLIDSPLEPSRSLVMDRNAAARGLPFRIRRCRASCCQGARPAVLQGSRSRDCRHRDAHVLQSTSKLYVQLAPAIGPRCRMHSAAESSRQSAPAPQAVQVRSRHRHAARESRTDEAESLPWSSDPVLQRALRHAANFEFGLLPWASGGSRLRNLHSLDFAVSGKHYASGSSTVALTGECNSHNKASTAN